MLDAADRQIMLEACGVLATDSGGGTLYVSPPEYADPQVMFSGIDQVTVNPFCQAASEDIDTLGIVPGETGSLLTIEGHQYRVLSIKPTSSGFVLLELGAV